MKARLLLAIALVGGSLMVSPAGGAHAAERVGALNAAPSDASFDLSWTKPSDAPGQTGVPSGWEINGYVVRVFNSAFPADGLVKICQHQAGDAQACTVTTDVDGSGSDDLVNGVQYSVSVAARWKDPGADLGNTIDDEDVEGTESALVTVTPRTVPNAPGSPTAAYTDSSEFSDDEVPTITATVSWTTPDNGGATIDQYDALPVDVDGNAIGPDADSSTTSDNETGCTAAGESTLQCDMSGLSLNSTFYFDVSATNDAGASQTARSARLVTPPGPPAITAVTNVAAGVQVTWSAPEGTASITEYTIEALDSTGAVASTTTWTSGTLRSTFTELTEGEGYTFQVTGQNTSTYDGNALGTGYGVAGTWDQTVTVSGAGGAFIAIEGERVVNSRDDAATSKQGATAGYGTPLRVNVASGDVPSDASAVAVNLTVTNTEEWGFVSAYACSSTSMEEWPGNSNVNFDSAGMTIANSAVVPLTDGHLCLLTYGMTDVIMDVSGYFASGFEAIEGERVVNSRDDAATSKQGATAGYGTPLRVNVASGDVPSDASAVAVNLTVTNTEEWGFVSAYACSSTSMEEWPGNSNVNFDSAGMTIANSAVVPLTDGHLCLLTYGMTDVIMDVSGYFASGFEAIEGERVVNSRDDAATSKQGATAGYGTPLRVNVASGDVPSDASAVAVNLTVTNTEEWGFVSAYACSSTSMEEWPGNSNVNFDSAGMTIANSAVVPLTDGHLCLLTYGMTDVIMDVSGYFG